MRLQAKVALVAGAASGMGAAVVRRFCLEGAQVCAAGLQPDELGELARQTGAMAVPCDVTDDSAVRVLIRNVVDRHGRLDIVVNAAGIVVTDDAADIDDAVWQRTHEVNLGGAMRICRAALPIMQRQHAGTIVNISSVAAFNASAGMASYAASKAGLVAYTRALANRYGAEGIRANCLAPGWIRTPMSTVEFQETATAQGSTPAAIEGAIADRIALRRIGTVEEMAACVLFLASDESAFVTGAVLVADGGARTPAAARAH